MRSTAFEEFARAKLVSRIGVSVQVANGHAFDLLLIEHWQQRLHVGFDDWVNHVAVDVHALSYRQSGAPRHQGPHLLDHDVVLVETAFVTDFDNIAKAMRGDESRPRALALDNRVGRQSRAMDHEGDL